MKVKLIQEDLDQTCLINKMYIAAKTCYSAKSPIELEVDSEYMDLEKKYNLVKEVLKSGHQSIAEHVQFTFAIEGISRACSHQLVRHRHCTFSQQSQRYVQIKENLDFLIEYQKYFTYGVDCGGLRDIDNAVKKVTPILEEYFVDVNVYNVGGYLNCLINYLQHIEKGEKAEDARNFLPNATKTNIVMSVNLRELIHICHLRLCSRAQTEIRTLFNEIKNQIRQEYPLLAEFLHPSCEALGYCPEPSSRCCGRKPNKEQIFNN